MDVSIIIVNYNGFNLLKDCLTSIEDWTKDVNYEIIVIDNNSDEGNIEEITSQFKKLTLIKNNTNRGFAAANNQGIQIASGKYLLFLNNDTKFIENSIKIIFDFAKNYACDVFVGSELLNKDMTHQESVTNFPTLWNTFSESFFLYKIFKKNKNFNKYYLDYHSIKNPINVEVIKGAFMFCSVSAIKKLDGFDKRFYFYSEETDLCYRFKKNLKGDIVYFPNTSIVHYGGATTDKYRWFDFKNQTIAKIQYYQKHFDKISFVIVVMIYYLGVFIRIPIYVLIGLFLKDKKNLQKGFYYLKQLFIFPKNQFNK